MPDRNSHNIWHNSSNGKMLKDYALPTLLNPRFRHHIWRDLAVKWRQSVKSIPVFEVSLLWRHNDLTLSAEAKMYKLNFHPKLYKAVFTLVREQMLACVFLTFWLAAKINTWNKEKKVRGRKTEKRWQACGIHHIIYTNLTIVFHYHHYHTSYPCCTPTKALSSLLKYLLLLSLLFSLSTII